MLYVVWGTKMEKLLARSVASLLRAHPEMPIKYEWLDESASLLDKSRMMDFTPFETTLYLDADTVVMGKLDFGFQMAEERGLACCICECPWARRFAGWDEEADAPEYNSGVVFFSSERTASFFTAWKLRAQKTDSHITFIGDDGRTVQMPSNDQASFALAMRRAKFNPFVLPLNWNFRPKWQRSFFGPLKVWHDFEDPPKSVIEFSREQSQPGAIIDYAELAPQIGSPPKAPGVSP